MASNIFGASEGPQNIPKRTNPPGGKDSGIFGDHRPNPSRQLTNPPGGKTSNIFGSPEPNSTVRAHPNKPKDHIMLSDRGDVPQELKPKGEAEPSEEDIAELGAAAFKPKLSAEEEKRQEKIGYCPIT
ncbi:UNVERIFIED_CONTAM: hypothetical protein K2H54_014935 [Gekko kuhli]